MTRDGFSILVMGFTGQKRIGWDLKSDLWKVANLKNLQT